MATNTVTTCDACHQIIYDAYDSKPATRETTIEILGVEYKALASIYISSIERDLDDDDFCDECLAIAWSSLRDVTND